MSFDLNEVLKNSLVSVEESLGRVIGGIAGQNVSSDATTAVNTDPTWFNALSNSLSGFIGGFTSTKGGQAVVTQAGTQTATDTIKGFMANPVVWLAIGFGFIFLLVRKR
jgi:hypothetical protein